MPHNPVAKLQRLSTVVAAHIDCNLVHMSNQSKSEMMKNICLVALAAIAAAPVGSAQCVEHGSWSVGSAVEMRDGACVAAMLGGSRAAISPDNIPGSYYFSGTTYDAKGVAEKVFAPFSIEPGTGNMEYVVKKFIYDDSNDITATVVTMAAGAQYTDVQLTFASGQELFVDGGETYCLYAGFADPVQGWGAATTYEQFRFKMTDAGFVPNYSFNDGKGGTIPGGLAVAFRQGQQLLGWGFTDVELLRCNGEFRGLYTTDGIEYTEVADDVYGAVVKNGDKKMLLIHGIGGMPEPLCLTYDEADGSLTGRDQLAGAFTKYGETFGGYYTNGDPAGMFPKDMVVAGDAVVADGRTSVSLGNELLIWYPSEGDYFCAWGAPRIDFDVDLGIGVAAVDNVVADDDAVGAPVEYFNLQGQRVAAPAAGQPVIRRHGASVEKLIWH